MKCKQYRARQQAEYCKNHVVLKRHKRIVMKHTNPVQNFEMQQIKKEEEYHQKERKKVHQKLENN